MSMADAAVSRISVTKLHPVIGAEVKGVDLSRPLDPETVQQIKDAWHKHTVLVFRDQSISEDDQRRFASHFGPVAKRVQPRAGAVGVDSLLDWDDMLLITDNVDEKGKPKGALGHSFGAAGAIEAALTVFALRDGVVPPTLNLENLDERIELDVVAGRERAGDYRYAVSNSFSFGGQNVALVFGKY